MASDKPEYIFVDESGDPGVAPGTNPIYILAAIHVPKDSIAQLRGHLASFRYHNNLSKELKEYGPFNKDETTHQYRAFIEGLIVLTKNGVISATVNWLNKDAYKGPYLYQGADTTAFRNFQLKQLLIRHRKRGYWSDNVDVTLDRFDVSEAHHLNMRDYILKKVWGLEPRPAHLTMADSEYVGGLQVADRYTRLARRVVEGNATAWDLEATRVLMDLEEQTTGQYE